LRKSIESGRSRRALIACAAALSFAAATASAQAAELTIHSNPQAITYQQGSVKIGGNLTADGSVSVANRELNLYKRGYPYDKGRLVTTTRTDANGHYNFSDLEPDRNSTYKVAINDPDLSARSDSLLVVVFAQGKLNVRTKKNRHIVSKFELVYSPRLTTDLSGRKVFWYFNKVGNSRFTIKDRSRSFLAGKGDLKGKSNFEAPPGEYRFRITYCLDVPNKKDIGVGAPGTPRDCPKSFKARAARTLRSVGAVASPGVPAQPVAGAARD
jgi:Tfp pilus assembly protein FimT